MAIVIPSWRLEDFLNTREFVMQRQLKNRRYKEEQKAEERVAFDVEKPENAFTKETMGNS
ncbi:MAG TPA: hypothetical protein VJ180_14140 [Pyrinomonadaceae bacterium]|nr:hypothetical protein [Pyrinomonadaceae bacterium]